MLQHPTITIQDVSLSFESVPLFSGLTLTLQGGVWSCFLGPSGVGKSTLLKLIAGLIPPSVNVQGQVFSDIHSLHDHIAYMGQTDLLLPWLTVLDNTLLSYRLRGKRFLKKHAMQLLDQVGLHHSAYKYPYELSGGMRQRVALIRTLIQDKPIVLMDEPFSSVDAITRFELQSLAADLLKNHTVLFITHDPLEALRLAQDIYILSGQPVAIQKTLQLSTPIPRNPFDAEVVQLQSYIYQALTHAKEKMV